MKKIMRKVSVLLAAVLTVMSVAACSMKEPGSADTDQAEPAPAEETAEGGADESEAPAETESGDKKIKVGFVV